LRSIPKVLATNKFLSSSWTRKIGNIVFERDHDSGGHFAAYEKPNELVDDLRQMFGKKGPAFGVVSGKSGYAAERSGL
jgi:hypothetical protein